MLHTCLQSGNNVTINEYTAIHEGNIEQYTPSYTSQLTNNSGFLTAASFTNNNKGTSVGKVMVADSDNGLGYSTPSDLASVLGVGKKTPYGNCSLTTWTLPPNSSNYVIPFSYHYYRPIVWKIER